MIVKFLTALTCACICFTTSSAQLLVLPGKIDKENKISLKESEQDTVYVVPIRVNSPTTTVKVHIVDKNKNTADLGKDYIYVNWSESLSSLDKTIDIKPESDYLLIPVKILSRNDTVKKSFDIDFSYSVGKDTRIENLNISIIPHGSDAPIKPFLDTTKWRVNLITGGNFDFFDAPKFKDFAGDLHIFLPNLFQVKIDKKRNWLVGLQGGIFNYRYYEADSSNGRIRTDKYLLDPRVATPIIDSTAYVNEVYALNNKINYNTFGAYLSPMLWITGNKWADLYISAHFEGLWRTQISEDTRVSLRKDTLAWSATDLAQGVALQKYPGLRPTYQKRTFNDLYIGIGFPIHVNIMNRFEFFASSTIGVCAYDDITLRDSTSKNVTYRLIEPDRNETGFWLTKTYMVTTVAPIDIAIGGEFRQVFGHRAYYAVYLGAALSLADLKKE